MKRARLRFTILAAIRFAVGVVIASVIYDKFVGDSDMAEAVTILALLFFLAFEALYPGEVETAIEAVNLRVDSQTHIDTRQDARLEALERFVLGRIDDTPPHGMPVIREGGQP